jgi:predicted transcriptional regulator
MLMEAFVLCKPCVSAIYWDESRPVKELHKYIPHSTRPTELRSETLRLIDSKEAETFKKRAQRIVDLMDNLSEKITSEVRRLLEGEARVKKYRRRRSELDLYMEIVEIVSLRPSKLISLMHDTGISYNKLKALVNILVRKGLVAESSASEGKHYQATERGIDLLFDYKRIKEALE